VKMKFSVRPQFVRLQGELELIRQGVQRGRLANCSAFVAAYGISRFTALRDVEFLKGRVWHPSQRLLERRDGAVELRMRTSGWKELVRFVLSWQPDVRVLAPVRLRERVREKLRASLARCSP
jgi:hypothetical protein